jgi:hypothetical protein
VPAVRWRNDPGEFIWHGSFSKALCQIDCHARLRQTRQCKLDTLALRAQSPERAVRGFLVHVCPAFRMYTSRGALVGRESSGKCAFLMYNPGFNHSIGHRVSIPPQHGMTLCYAQVGVCVVGDKGDRFSVALLIPQGSP